jgi:hypothetical protein
VKPLCIGVESSVSKWHFCAVFANLQDASLALRSRFVPRAVCMLRCV